MSEKTARRDIAKLKMLGVVKFVGIRRPADIGWRATSCLIPDFDGAVLSLSWREALWDRFFTGAPQRQRQSVERYSIVKRA
jgi:hypothetical protein